jgi:iron complex transport system ATP-binding protein
MNAVELENITYAYGKNLVLENISFTVKHQEFFSIIGPNGSGKTTLLKIIGGILKPLTGAVKIFQEPINKIPLLVRARILSYVPQESYFAVNFSVLEVVLLGRHPYLKPMARPRAHDIEIALHCLEITGALPLKDRKINELSSGERQRVVLARALASEPKILLLDEPTAFLDIKYQVEILKILKELNSKGLTIIFLTHDLNLAVLVAQRILVLSDRNIVDCDLPDKIINEDLLEKVYKVSPHVIKHPKNQKPQILLNL